MQAFPIASMSFQGTARPCYTLQKEKKSSFGGRKKAKPEEPKDPYFFFTNLRIKELPMARNLGGNLNEDIKRGQANAGTRHVNDRINTPCSTLVGQGEIFSAKDYAFV